LEIVSRTGTHFGLAKMFIKRCPGIGHKGHWPKKERKGRGIWRAKEGKELAN
jgi:hypothetical protein